MVDIFISKSPNLVILLSLHTNFFMQLFVLELHCFLPAFITYTMPQARTGNAKSVNDSTCTEFIVFFQSPFMSVRVARAAACSWSIT